MANISVSIHTFNIEETSRGHNKYKIKKELNSGIINDSDNMFSVIRKFCVTCGEYIDNEINSSVFKVSEDSFTTEKDEISNRNFRHMILKVNSGEYGFTEDLVDPKTKSIEYQKAANVATVRPFFVSIIVDTSKNVQKGFIIFQNVGIYSIKTIFKTYFSEFLKGYNTQDKQYEFNLGEVTPKQFAMQLLDQYSVKQVRVIANKKPLDSAEMLDKDFVYLEETRVYKSFAKIQNTVKKVYKYIEKHLDITDIIEIENFNYDDIKLDLDLGKGKTRTLDLINIDRITMKLNFSDADIKGVDGHADKRKLKKEVESIYKTYSKNINFTYPNNDYRE